MSHVVPVVATENTHRRYTKEMKKESKHVTTKKSTKHEERKKSKREKD